MSKPDNVHDELGVKDLVHDSEVTDPNPVDRVLALHRDAGRWSGILAQEINRGSNALLIPTLKSRK